MTDRRLKQDFRKVWVAAFGEDGAQQRRNVQAVINPDATLNREGVLPVLPWSARDVFIPGEVATAADLLRLAFPQGARIRHVAIAARTPPSGGAFGITMYDGTQTHAFSLPAGQSFNPAGADIRIATGSPLPISVAAANGVEDVTLTIHYSVGGS